MIAPTEAVMAGEHGGEQGASPDRQRIWDLPLRLCHWLLAGSVAGSLASHYAGSGAFRWHVRFGCLTLALVAFRLGWTLCGPRYARLGELLQRPWRRAGAVASPGHTRAGGWMALLLLALLGAQALCGLGANDDVTDSGPLSGWAGRALSDRLSAWHETLATVLWIAIGAHVAAALYYLWVRREDRITPLVTGDKRALPPGSGIGEERLWRALVLAGLIGLALWALLSNAPAPLDLAE